jgi:toxin FitB
MNGTVAELLIDTDVFIDHLRGARQFVAGDDTIWYSVVTRCELFAGSKDDEEILRELLEPFTEVPIDRHIAEAAGRIRRFTGARIADALIAATAIEHNLTLVTRNIRDFEQVRQLRLHAP